MYTKETQQYQMGIIFTKNFDAKGFKNVQKLGFLVRKCMYRLATLFFTRYDWKTFLSLGKLAFSVKSLQQQRHAFLPKISRFSITSFGMQRQDSVAFCYYVPMPEAGH
jgi:hypothetical protein